MKREYQVFYRTNAACPEWCKAGFPVTEEKVMEDYRIKKASYDRNLRRAVRRDIVETDVNFRTETRVIIEEKK